MVPMIMVVVMMIMPVRMIVIMFVVMILVVIVRFFVVHGVDRNRATGKAGTIPPKAVRSYGGA
jgi:uncharacterized membrane protein YsdA (DUF1294 family)